MGQLIDLRGNRYLRFAFIGLLCLVPQTLVMLALMEFGVTVLPANAAGFMLSTAINFFLQRRFTFDKAVEGNVALGLLKFFGTSVVAFCVNTVVVGFVFYTLGSSVPPAVVFVRSTGFGVVDTWALFASFVGAVAGSALNYQASKYFRTFGRLAGAAESSATAEIPATTSVPAQQAEETEVRPQLAHLRWLLEGRTLAVFMPAYREAENLPTTVGKLVDYLRTLQLLDFKVVIVNDGSPDDTGAVADKLAAAFPDEVMVIHHAVNQGYGGALITGFNAVVELGFDLWAFCDSDGQFDPKSFGTILEGLFDEEGRKVADLTVGYRLGRRNSDSPWRFYLGRAWHFFGKFMVGYSADGTPLLDVHDVDCGIKGGFTKSLALIVEQLRGKAAAISPELIALTNMSGQTIVERGVTHLSRLAGTSTGDSPKVMIRSALNITLLGLRFRITRYFGWVSDPLGDAQEALHKEGWFIQ
jgi:putative flippase GtrA